MNCYLVLTGVLIKLLLCHISSVFGAKVLFFVPTLSYSHVTFNGRLADALVARGHSVESELCDPLLPAPTRARNFHSPPHFRFCVRVGTNSDPVRIERNRAKDDEGENDKVRRVQVVLLALVDSTLPTNGSKLAEIRQVDVGVPAHVLPRNLWYNPGPFENSSPTNPLIMAKLFRVASIFVRACQVLATDTELLNSLRAENFDVGLVEQYDSCGFGVFASIGIKGMLWTSATAVFRPQPEALGVNFPLSYVPELFAPQSDEMSFFSRVENLLIATVTGGVHAWFSRAQQSHVFRQRGMLSDGRGLLEVSRDSHAILINSQPVFDFAMPHSQQILSIGGLSVNRHPPPLSEKWSSVANSSEFVLVTFGSIARTTDMSVASQEWLFSAFSFFPSTTFIVKFEEVADGELPFFSPNVLLTKWMPQLQLLAHPNCRGIVTHGGWSTIMESLTFARPLIIMPLFAGLSLSFLLQLLDHAKNAKVIEKKGVGLTLDKLRLSTGIIVRQLRALLEDPKYRANSEKFSAMLRAAAPVSPEDVLDSAVRRAATLKSPSKRRPMATPREAFQSPLETRLFDIFLLPLFAFALSSL